MKDNKWINERISMIIIEMGFLFAGDREDDIRWAQDNAKCELLKEMLE